MTELPREQVTRLLDDWSAGNRKALDALMPLVHQELRRVASRHLARERPGHTLQPTALVNEVYLKLVGERDMKWQGRAHFVSVVARLMRFVLIDHVRKKQNVKRGGAQVRVTFDEGLEVSDEKGFALVALDEALEKLAAQDERKSRIAELRFFGGLSVEETAEAMGVSVATIMREWRLTRAFLQRELS